MKYTVIAFFALPINMIRIPGPNPPAYTKKIVVEINPAKLFLSTMKGEIPVSKNTDLTLRFDRDLIYGSITIDEHEFIFHRQGIDQKNSTITAHASMRNYSARYRRSLTKAGWRSPRKTKEEKGRRRILYPR